MKKLIPLPILTLALLIASFGFAQTTSWTGASNTTWTNASNWTNGVPTAAVDAVLGDANFTGPNQPNISRNSTCLSLTLGGTVATTLTNTKALTIAGNLLINSGSTFAQGRGAINISGNWTNNGAYTTANQSLTTFKGTTQTISGTTASAFRRVTINSGSIVTFMVNISVVGAFTLNGTLIPAETINPILSGTGSASLTVNSGASLRVNASTFALNYSVSTTVNGGSIVEYSSAVTNQTVSSAPTYSTLTISGGTTKTLAGNITLSAALSTHGNIFVNSGTLDLATFTANRLTTTVGGSLILAVLTTLRIGGLTTNFFPLNFSTVSLALTSNTEYYGGAGTQLVSLQNYGNLILTGTGGASIRTMPASALTINGNLVSRVTAGTLTYNAQANITVSNNDSIGSFTTYNAGSGGFIYRVSGHLFNNGTITGNTNSTVIMDGPGFLLSGSGTNNFNNFTISASGITANTTSINVSGNLTMGSAFANFLQASGGTLNMTGSGKIISGNNFTFANLNIATGASVTTAADFTVAGNFSTTGTGTFSATAGTMTITGSARTISTGGSTAFNSVVAFTGGSVTTASNFTINSMLIVQGSFTASAGSATFNGAPSSLSGTANLFDVIIPATKTLQLNSNSILGVAGTLTTTGTFNTSATVPNTVVFNSSAATQTIPGLSYNNLIIANGNTKNAAAGVTVAGDFTLNSSTTFNAGTFSHAVQRNFTNSGIFNAGTGTATVTLSGASDATITGATTFNILTVNKTSGASVITVASNVGAATVNMTSGNIATGINTLTITINRAGTGIITGIITHAHSFTPGIAYPFESPNNTIAFTGLVTSVTMKITTGTPISDFPLGSSINREYQVTSVTGTQGTAVLRLHYEDVELNGNSEATMALWRYGTNWLSAGKTLNDVNLNYVEYGGIIDVIKRWTLSDNNGSISWKGTTSTDWFTGSNWSGSTVPSSTSIVVIGDANFSGINQPLIFGNALARSIQFASNKASTLTLTGGSLAMSGNISGLWSANTTHNIITNGQNITVNGDIILSDGTAGHAIDLTIGTGTVTVAGSLTETGGANVSFTGAGNLIIGDNFNYTSGTFTAGTGTLTYNGSTAQTVAAITYNNLTVNKTSGIASINNTTIGGNLTASVGELDLNAKTTITGNVVIGASGRLVKTTSDSLIVGGNWTNSGVFTVATGMVVFNGSSTQTLTGATSFNSLIVAKTTGSSLVLANNVTVNSDLIVNSGILDLSTFSANRASPGGTFTLANNAALYVSGANNFPSNYIIYAMDTIPSPGNSSLVLYNGSVAQTIPAVSYGNLTFSGAGTKTFTASGNTTVKGNFDVNAGATVNASSNVITLWGNWVNSGTFTPSTSTILLYGSGKTITGNTTFNQITFYGSYSALNDLTFNTFIRVTTGGIFNAGGGLMTVNGDFTNNGSTSSSGIITFSGTVLQTIRVQNALVSTSTGIVNFNGTVAPVLNSTTNTNFATVNINNTAGIAPSLPWNVFVAINVASGSSWNGGAFAHNFFGGFTNNGTVTSSGTLNFIPSIARSFLLAGTFTSTGSVVMGGSGTISTTGAVPTFTNITIANSAGVSPGTNWNISGNFIINNNAIFNAGGNTYTVAGNVNTPGTLNPGTSLFSMTSATGGSIDGSINSSFYDLTLPTGANIVVGSDFNISRNLSTIGNFSSQFSTGVINFTGALAATISGTGTRLPDFEIVKNAGVTVTLSRNIDSLGSMTITSGILDAGSAVITQDPTALAVTTMDIVAAGTLRTAGVFPTLTNYTLDSLSTVEYYSASAQTVRSLSALQTSLGAGSAYGNLIISGAGAKTASNTLNIRNNFTLSAGSIAFASPDTLGGNWNVIGGSFTSGTLVFNGGANQDINTTGSFGNINVNKPAGYINLSSNTSASGVLTFTLGKIYTNANNLILTSTLGTVNGAAQGTGWVNGNLRKTIPTGAGSVVRPFEIGGINFYTPASINFASVGTSGTLTAKATSTEHPQIATSGLDASKSVNRYFTLTNSGIVFSTAIATFNWVSSDVDAGATTANFLTSRYNGSTWAVNSVASPLSTSIQATGLTAFGDFAIGERGAKVWTGITNTLWNLNTNWNPQVIPVLNEDVLIPTGSIVDINTTVTTNNFTVSTLPGTVVNILSGNSLTVNGNLNLTAGIVNINGQTLTLNGTFNGSAANYIRGSQTSALIIGSTFTTPSTSLFFDQTASTFNNYLKTFTVNQTATVGNALNIAGGANANAGTISLATGVTLNTGGLVTLKSDATGTARIAALPIDANGVATSFISGDVTIERFIPARRTWRLLSTPLKSAGAPTLNAAWQEGVTTPSPSTTVDPNPGFGTHITGGTVANGFDQGPTLNSSIKYYDTTLNALTNLSTTYFPITNYPGYFIFIRGNRSILLSQGTSAVPSNTVLRMKGQVNTGRITSAVVSGQSGRNTLIGNPYPSAIDFGTLTRNNVSNIIYLWDPKLAGNYAIGGYVTGTYNTGTMSYIFTSSASPVSQYVPSGEAFYVVPANAALPASISMNETDKSTSGSDQVFGFTASPMNGAVVRVNLSSVNPDNTTILDDGLLAIYGDSLSNSVNSDDAIKILNVGENIALKRDGSLLSIELRKTFTGNDTLFINSTQLRKIAYRLDITIDGMNTPGLVALLKDKYDATNNDKVLASTGITSVDFTVNTDPLSFAADRFSIVFEAPLVIPVTYTSINANRSEKNVVVKWNIENEINMASYDVETSADGLHFTAAGNVPVHTQTGTPYTFTNYNASSAIHFYRIKGIENNGRIIYSSIVKVAATGTEIPEIKVYNNRGNNNITLTLTGIIKGNYNVALYDITGRLLQKTAVNYTGGTESFNIPSNNYPAGKYQVKVSSAENTYSASFLKL